MKCIRCNQNVTDVSKSGVCVVCLDIECDMMKRAIDNMFATEQRAERAENIIVRLRHDLDKIGLYCAGQLDPVSNYVLRILADENNRI